MLALGMSSLSVEGASSIAQGFQTDNATGTVPGTVVSLKPGSPNTVELSTSENVDQMLGIVGGALIELSGANGKVQVVTTGETTALVSDINGDVKTGDKITASPVAGIGMKALRSMLVIGTAQASLADVTTESRSIKGKDGKEQTIHVGAILLQVDRVFYESPQDVNSFVPVAIQDFATSLAGRPVSPVRIVIAGLLIILLFAVIGILLYSAVHSSIISIGRNPLSESGVRKSLVEVGLTIVGVLVFTVIVVYLILKT